jgi:serine/threonine protein kinase
MEAYEIGRVVGKGSFGEVYLCTRLADHAELVLKKVEMAEMSEVERDAALKEVPRSHPHPHSVYLDV